MRPSRFRVWAEEQIRQSPAIASVEPVQAKPPNEHITYSHVTLATGARITVHWIGGSPVGANTPHIDDVITGSPPEPVKVPELATSGRLRVVDIEAHLVALITNGGHEEVESVVASSQQPSIYTDGTSYAIRVSCHSGHSVTGYFRYILSGGEQPSPSTEFRKREEV